MKALLCLANTLPTLASLLVVARGLKTERMNRSSSKKVLDKLGHELNAGLRAPAFIAINLIAAYARQIWARGLFNPIGGLAAVADRRVGRHV
jgi:hypothetical protein